ncbi:10874_t:CDS:10 [Entrophospora sp. SA101]|nr:10874_t:CDS:10 [Entrophospora sp. SA101]
MSNNDDKCAGKWGPRHAPNPDPHRQWAAVRRRYEWNDSYDDGVAPRDEELEKELFGEDNHVNTGINFEKYDKIKTTINNPNIKPISTFDEAKLHPAMKENIKLAKYTIPTPVQKYSIPVITDGLDLMACAQTGSGKTAAFLIPILSQIFTAKRNSRQSTRRYKAEPLMLILAPTRELATQIFDECRRFTYRSMMRPCVVYGGAESGPQRTELGKGCDILTATPGRLNDFLDRGILSLRKVRYLVLDEADRMLDMGFEADIRKIVQESDLLDDGSRQTMMFSATFPKNIRELAKDFLKNDYSFLTVGRLGGTTSDITQKIRYVDEKDKRTTLVELLLQQPPSRTLIFVETKRGADSLDDYLYHQNFPTTSIHGDRSQREREDALISFKNGRSPILIATAVAARGLDIKNVMHVINYDLCNDIDEYVHRIGRTARVGNEGLATTFYNQKNSDIAGDLVKLLLECKQDVPDFLQSYAPTNYDLDEDTDSNYNNKRGGGDSGGYRNQNNKYKNNDSSDWNASDTVKPMWDSNTSATTGSSWDPNNTPWDSNSTSTQTQQQLPPPLQPQQPSHRQPPQQYQSQVINDNWSTPTTTATPIPQRSPFQQQSPPPNLQPPLQPFQQQSSPNLLQPFQQQPPQPQLIQSQYSPQPSYSSPQLPQIYSPQPLQPQQPLLQQYGSSAPQQSLIGQQPNPNNNYNQTSPPQQQNNGYNSPPQQQTNSYQQMPPQQQPLANYEPQYPPQQYAPQQYAPQPQYPQQYPQQPQYIQPQYPQPMSMPPQINVSMGQQPVVQHAPPIIVVNHRKRYTILAGINNSLCLRAYCVDNLIHQKKYSGISWTKRLILDIKQCLDPRQLYVSDICSII